MRILPGLLLTAVLAATAAAEPNSSDPFTREADTAPEGAHTVQCTSVSTTWPVHANRPQEVTGPQFSVVRTDTRPKDVQLHLDGRFVGRARYFNGKKGYLFLEPGRYRLEMRLGGYRTEVFMIEARPNCRFDIKQRLVKAHGAGKTQEVDSAGKGVPQQRSFGPVENQPEPAQEAVPTGPDPSLRTDLDTKRRSPPAVVRRDASLRLEVQPAAASVYLDGAFLATGEELARMVGPLAVAAGSHVLEVMAPGYVAQKLTFEIGRGELEELRVFLDR